MSRKMVQFECEETKLTDALDRLRELGVGRLTVYAAEALPASPMLAKQFETRAQAIAKAIQPRQGQDLRRETLQLVLSGSDTFFGQHGEPDPALRNATGALSKALRRFAPYDESPLDILVRRTREVWTDAPLKGQYRGTRYTPTNLGVRVREILLEWRAI